jgi:hypothetical protein
MSVRLEDTNAGAVSAAIASERRRMGGGATGLVLTLVIPCEEADASDALTPAATAPVEFFASFPGLVDPNIDSTRRSASAEMMAPARPSPCGFAATWQSNRQMSSCHY